MSQLTANETEKHRPSFFCNCLFLEGLSFKLHCKTEQDGPASHLPAIDSSRSSFTKQSPGLVDC